MEVLHERILKFIRRHHIFHMSVADEHGLWASTCFFALNEKNASFIFTSENNTRHSCALQKNPQVSGSIALETKIVGKIQGIQFTGRVFDENSKDFNIQKGIYYRRFPFAIAYPAPFWELELEYVKMTDNMLGFGKKLIWQRIQEV